MLVNFEIQEHYRRAIETRDTDKIKALIQTGILPDSSNMLAMKRTAQATPFCQDGKEDPFWQVYLNLLEKSSQYKP